MDFFRDRDTYQRRTWIRRKTPLNAEKTPGPKSSPEKTTEPKGRKSATGPRKPPTEQAQTADDDEVEDMQVDEMAVLSAVTRPLDFQRQGHRHP